jgi:hypothetical protein
MMIIITKCNSMYMIRESGDATVYTYIIMASCIFICENSFQN